MAKKLRDNLLVGLHVFSCMAFSFSVYYDHMCVRIPSEVVKTHSAWGGKFKFLTFWDAILQALFFFVCVGNDFFGSSETNPKERPFLRRLKDYIHATLGYPVAMFVGVTFWALMFVDRELVLPRALDPYFPWWLNHLMHTLIMVSTILEMGMAPRQYPKRRDGCLGLVAFMAIYLVWMHIVYMKSGVWTYPILGVLSLPLRVVFFATLLALSMILYVSGEMLNRIIWGSAEKHSVKSSKKKKSK